jgi:hypothetical protein
MEDLLAFSSDIWLHSFRAKGQNRPKKIYEPFSVSFALVFSFFHTNVQFLNLTHNI